MQIVKPVGQQAASRKYDLLSALTAFGLASERGTQTRVMRLLALITARYNWQRDELCVGQKEIARLWSVDERTVKREMARLRAQGWLVQKSRGVRGRISVHGLDLLQIMEDTRPAWPLVGPDFVARMAPDGTPAQDSNVVPLHRPEAARTALPEAPALGTAQGPWARAQAILAAEQPALFKAWFATLQEAEAGQGALTLAATSAFQKTYITTHCQQALLAAVRRADPSIARVDVIC